MKKLFAILAVLILIEGLFAQSPQRMSYQAVIRNAGNTLVTNHVVGMKVSILQGAANGTSVYAETQTLTTNTNGLATIEIGGGTPVTGTLESINWANGPYFIKTETDPTGGTNYSISGTSQLLSVPYALYAKTAENVTGGIAEIDPIFGAWNKSTGVSITASQVSDFQSGVTNNTSVLANTAKNSYPAADAAKLAAITGTNTGDQDLSGKVDKVAGKGLSTNDYTTAEQTKVSNLSGINTGDQDLSGKVDKIAGKGLSTNDYTTGEQTKLAAITGTNTGDQDLSGKVDKVAGKGLSTNDYTTAEATKLAGIASGAEVNVNADWSAVSGDAQILNKPIITGTNTGDQDLSGKVDKVAGKGLSTNDYTTAEQTKLAAITGTNTGDQDLSGKVDKVAGKGLSTNDYTTAEQTKLAGIASGAEVNVNADWNAVSGDAQILNKPIITGTNTGDNATNSQYSGLVTNATHTGEVTGSDALTIDNAAVIGKVLTGYTSGAGTIVATDNILQAIQKLNGNDGSSNATHTGDATGATALTLATVNSNVGTFNNVTINAKGLATAASNVAYLTSETDPTVKAITGIVKSNGTTISAATAGTDYLTPSGSGASLTGITSTQVGAPSGSGTSTGTNTGDQTLPTLSGLGGVAGNTAITGATKTKITYDAKGLVTAGADATTADVAASTDKNYVTDAQLTVIGNTSGLNTGDQTLSGLGGVAGNTAITGATKTKITYDAKGLVTAGADATTADIAASTDKKYVTDAQQTVISNTSGTNSGDQTLSGLGGVPASRTVNSHALSSDVVVTATDVNLGNVTNESKTTMFNSPTFTGTISGITAAMVGAPSGSGSSTGTNTGDQTLSGLGGVVGNTAITGATNTKITYDSKGLVTSGAAANLASSDFANQGTTTTVLHGNASGNPSFGAVSLSTDVTGILPVANGGMGADVTPAGAGEVLYSSSTTAYGHLGAGTSGQVLTSGGTGAPTWQSTGATAWSLLGNASTVDGTNFIGTTDDKPFNVRVNNDKAGRIENNPATANTFFGYKAGNVNTGYQNTGNGYYALFSNTTGGYNTAIGESALYSNVAGYDNTAIGYQALYSNTGSYNTANGYRALYSNTTGTYNTANGYQALYSNTLGARNTANGYYALYSNVAGSNATAIGYNAMQYANNTATAFENYNVALGFEALRGSTDASANIGNYNTALGYKTLWSNTTGNSNTANGVNALLTNTTGSNNTALGYGADVSSSSLTNATAIGNGAIVNAGNNVQIGNSAVTDVYFGNPTTTVLHGVAVREVADEPTPTAGQTPFTLTQTPSANSKVKMYINGVRISNIAYSLSGATLTYIPANNGGYALLGTERIQFDYYY